MLVHCQVLHAPQRPTNGTLDNAGVRMRAGGGREAACRKPQLLPGKSEVPKGGTTSDRPCGTWPDGSSMALLTKTEVTGGGKLGVENVEGGDTYIGTGGLNIVRDTTRLLLGKPKGTNNAY